MSDILIAEDSVTQSAQIRGLVEAAGFETRVVCNGVEALRAVAERAPLAVLTDLDMPEMNGLDLVVALCRDHPGIPVVLMTAFGSEEIAIAALQAGAASYVPKKNLAQDLVDTLRDVLEVSHAQREDARLAGCLSRIEASFELPSLSAPVMEVVGYVQNGMTRLKVGTETNRLRLGVALNAAIQNSIYCGNLELTTEQLHDAYHVGDAGKTLDRMVFERSSASPYAQRRLFVQIEISRSQFKSTIRHEGPGFAPQTMTELDQAAELAGDYASGWLRVRSFVDQLTFDPSGTEVTLTHSYRS